MTTPRTREMLAEDSAEPEHKKAGGFSFMDAFLAAIGLKKNRDKVSGAIGKESESGNALDELLKS